MLPLCEIARILGVPRRTVYYHVARRGVKPKATETGGHLRGRTRGLYDVAEVKWAYAARHNCGPRRPGVDYGVEYYEPVQRNR